MATPFRLAALGHTMDKGRVVEWFVEEGGPVTEGEPLLAVETDKATVDVEAPISGALLKVIGQVDEEYPVGALLAWIGEPGEAIPDIAPEPVAAAETVAPERRVTPVARRLAERHGIDPDALSGTGPGGRVSKEDVQRAIEAGPLTSDATPAAPPLPRVEVVPLTGLRRTAAERLGRSWPETPLVTEGIEVDFSACAEERRTRADAWLSAFGVRPSVNDLILKATALALRAHPGLNAALIDGAIHRYRDINLGVAINVKDGLVAPVVRGVDGLDLGALSRAVNALAERARSGRLTPDDFADGTFTVTNLGAFGIDWFTPLPNPPQSAILGVGRVRPKPMARDGEVVVRNVVTLMLSFDHRVIDGAPCARFLADLSRLIEQPAQWLE